MVTIEINGHKLVFYHSAEEMPIRRYSKFQKYKLIESGVGSDMQAVGEHFQRLNEFLAYNMTAEALQEGRNLYYNFYMILEELNVKSLAFASLLHSIDGQPFDDVSEDNLKSTVDTLSAWGLSQKTVEHWVGDVKKK